MFSSLDGIWPGGKPVGGNVPMYLHLLFLVTKDIYWEVMCG